MDLALEAGALTILVGVIYLVILRFMDLNEREPFWALLMALAAGIGAALLARALFGGRVLVVDRVLGPIVEEGAIFLGLGAVLVLLGIVAGARGYSEFQGPMDGLVYGAAVGLGFAVGNLFLRELTGGSTTQPSSAFGTLWTAALAGLSTGLFGGILGLGFGYARLQRSAGGRVAAVGAGLVGAVVVHIAYSALARAGNVADASRARTWIALLLPLVLVIGVATLSLIRERRAIRGELESEAEAGVVAPHELRLLASFPARQGAYARRFFSGDFDGWLALRTLLSKEVQLALAMSRERRLGGEGSSPEIAALRATIAASRRQAERAEGE